MKQYIPKDAVVLGIERIEYEGLALNREEYSIFKNE